MKFQLLINTPDVIKGGEGWETAKYLRKIIKEIETLSPDRPIRAGIKDFSGKPIGFWSLKK
jgi:hypothetical protein